MKKPILYLVVPCYNEEAVLPATASMFSAKLKDLIEKKKIDKNSKVLFINDGSDDGTWKIIQELAKNHEYFAGVSQSRNRGHQNALFAGLMEAKDLCDITISIDCDGQDDIHAIEDMVDAYYMGYEIVYGVRSKRTSDTFFKRFSAESFYRLLNWMGVEIVFNHADFRLISRRVLTELEGFREVNLFLRGIIPLIGFKSTCIFYERQERIAGISHYSAKKAWSLAFEGITSLSLKPIHMIACFGTGMAFFSFLFIVYFIIHNRLGREVMDLKIITSVICFIGGLQLICLGILGEYIGKIYMEVKARPRYIISERTYQKTDPQDKDDN